MNIITLLMLWFVLNHSGFSPLLWWYYREAFRQMTHAELRSQRDFWQPWFMRNHYIWCYWDHVLPLLYKVQNCGENGYFDFLVGFSLVVPNMEGELLVNVVLFTYFSTTYIFAHFSLLHFSWVSHVFSISQRREVISLARKVVTFLIKLFSKTPVVLL